MKFQRRKDLTSETRLWIATSAFLQQGVWGAITELAEKYEISRQLVYIFLWKLKEVFTADSEKADAAQAPEFLQVRWDKLILSLKLDGCSSGGDISAVFKSLDLPNNSAGGISLFLNRIAAAIPDEIPVGTYQVIALADEVFSAGKPILILLEAKSHYILKAIVADDRSSETWASVYKSLTDKGWTIELVVGDNGTGLKQGCQKNGLVHHPDLFHLTTPFAVFLSRYERKAYQASAEEYERERVIKSAATEAVEDKRIEKYCTAIDEAEEAVDKYENYSYLWQCFVRSFDLFDEDGTLRTAEVVKGEIEAILELMETEIGDKALLEVVRKFRKLVADYWGYFERAEQIHQELRTILSDDDALREVCLGWQAEKQSRAAKSYRQKKTLEAKADEHFFLARCVDIDGIDQKIASALERLEDNVRSSSPLEAVNSQIRDFINSSRGQMSQEMLNLIVYFLNHKTAPRGPYKGTSPWERLTGRKEDADCLDRLLELAANNG